MALYLKQDQDRTELQQKISEDLKQKAIQKSLQDRPDGVTDSNFVKNTKETSGLAWVWILLAVLCFIGLVWLIIATASV